DPAEGCHTSRELSIRCSHASGLAPELGPGHHAVPEKATQSAVLAARAAITSASSCIAFFLPAPIPCVKHEKREIFRKKDFYLLLII
ncbi:hypothetical protein ILT44_07380, partial [Microvirga sp. BT689]|uniref:hypothetical protein n=1 Tax=Microvirga arvi TaxID=2778731 RepID=UPI00194F2A16